MKNTDYTYARMGMAAMVPGLQRAAELLAAEVAKFKALLSDEGTTHSQRHAAKRISKNTSKTTGPASYWYKMTPEQRRAEMQRRVLVRAGKAEPKKGDSNAARKARRNEAQRKLRAAKKAEQTAQ